MPPVIIIITPPTHPSQNPQIQIVGESLTKEQIADALRNYLQSLDG